MNKRFFLFALLLYGCAVTAQTSISRAEYWIDTDPGRGEATALPLAGNTVSAGISTAGLSSGWHTIGLRAIGDGNSSQTYTRTFFVLSPETADVEKVTGVEFFFDTDPGRGQATALPFTPDQTEFAISLQQMDTLPQGIHTIGLRVRKGPQWSETYTRTFFVLSPETADVEKVTGLEFFFDTDPGRGQATALPFTPDQTEFAISLLQMDTLPQGIHTIGLRVRKGPHWSETYSRTFFVLSPQTADVEKVSGAEYFIDADPGYGLATAIPFTPTQTDFALSLQQMDTLPQGIHTIGLRVRKGPHWSETYTRTFLNTVIHSPMQVTDVEAYWDNDTTAIIALPFTQEEGYYAVNTPLSTEGLTEGTHTLTIRVKADEIYSIIQVFEVVNEEQPTAVDDTRDGQAPKTYKILRNGQIYILRMEKTYTVGGQEVK